jgi:hypothetical protein
LDRGIKLDSDTATGEGSWFLLTVEVGIFEGPDAGSAPGSLQRRSRNCPSYRDSAVNPRDSKTHALDPMQRSLKNSYLSRAFCQNSISVAAAKTMFGNHIARRGSNLPVFPKLSAPVSKT